MWESEKQTVGLNEMEDTNETRVKEELEDSPPSKKPRTGTEAPSPDPEPELQFVAISSLPTEIAHDVPLISVNKKVGKLTLRLCANQELFIVNEGEKAHDICFGSTVAGFYKGKWVSEVPEQDDGPVLQFELQASQGFGNLQWSSSTHWRHHSAEASHCAGG